jgi:V/A-type H+-transporting ATPase subunit I
VRHGRLLPVQPLWALLVGAGLTAAGFGLLYGEAFGPTGLVPRLWLDPIERPVPLLALALGVGGVLLVVSHCYGVVNRYREGGLGPAILSPSGVAGLAVLAGAALVAAGVFADGPRTVWLGCAVGGSGVLLLAVGFLVTAGDGVAAVTQAGIELVDAVVRIASNILSFTRLAAFGVMHAALGLIVYAAAGALWGGVAGSFAAGLVFVVGNVLAFALELLVTGVQALRLEFYELFSRIFSGEGHPFSPWRVPVVSGTEES